MQRSHIELALRAFLVFERFCFRTGYNWGATNAKIFQEAVRAFRTNLWIGHLTATAQVQKLSIEGIRPFFTFDKGALVSECTCLVHDLHGSQSIQFRRLLFNNCRQLPGKRKMGMFIGIKYISIAIILVLGLTKIHSQDLLKSKDSKTFGHWQLSENGLEHKPMIDREKTGFFYHQLPLPENFTINFEWIEKTKTRNDEPAGGLSFKYGHSRQFGQSFDYSFSGYLIKIHTENPIKDHKTESLNGEINSSVLCNFMNPIGKLNKGRISCHEQIIQVLINDNLVYDLDLTDIFKANLDGVDLDQEIIRGLKNWSDAKKKGLYTSITLDASPKNSGFALVKNLVISDHKNNPMSKPLVDSINDKEAFWCKSGNLDPEKTKIYKEFSLFLNKNGYRNAISSETDLLEPFSGFKNPLVSNNQLLAQEFSRRLFNHGKTSGLKIETYFIANIKDKCNSSIRVFQFGNQGDAKKALDICKSAFKNEDGKLLTCKTNGNYVLLCIKLEDNSDRDANVYYKDINDFFLSLKP